MMLYGSVSRWLIYHPLTDKFIGSALVKLEGRESSGTHASSPNFLIRDRVITTVYHRGSRHIRIISLAVRCTEAHSTMRGKR